MPNLAWVYVWALELPSGNPKPLKHTIRLIDGVGFEDLSRKLHMAPACGMNDPNHLFLLGNKGIG